MKILRKASLEYIKEIGGFQFTEYMNSRLKEIPPHMEPVVLLDFYTHKSGIAYSDFKIRVEKLGPNDISSISMLGIFLVPSCELIEIDI